MNGSKIKNLAHEISSKIECSGIDAAKLFLTILTECNYHKEKMRLEPIIKRIILNN